MIIKFSKGNRSFLEKKGKITLGEIFNIEIIEKDNLYFTLNKRKFGKRGERRVFEIKNVTLLSTEYLKENSPFSFKSPIKLAFFGYRGTEEKGKSSFIPKKFQKIPLKNVREIKIFDSGNNDLAYYFTLKNGVEFRVDGFDWNNDSF